MSNPYDQFIPKDTKQPEQPPQPVVLNPGDNPVEAGYGKPVGNNVYDSPENMEPQNGPLSKDEFAAQLYERLNKGEKPADIVEWSKQAGHEIQTTGKAGEAFYENIRLRDEALKQNRAGVYGRVNETPRGEADQSLDINDVGAFARKAANVPLFNFGDEISAGLAAIPRSLRTGESLPDAYRKNWLDYDLRNELDEQFHPLASGAGEVAGVAASMFAPGAVYDNIVGRLAPKIVEDSTIGTRAANLATKMAVGAGTGAVTGATTATGEGSPDDRFKYAEGGSVVGALAGGGFPLVASAVGRLARPVLERLFPNSAKAAGERFALTNGELASMEAELQRQTDLGLNPTLLDILPERARNVVGSAGVHNAAREDLQKFAERRQTQLPERVQKQADEVLLPKDDAVPQTAGAPVEQPAPHQPEWKDERRLEGDDAAAYRSSAGDEIEGILETYHDGADTGDVAEALRQYPPNVVKRILSEQQPGSVDELGDYMFGNSSAKQQKFMEEHGPGDLAGLRNFAGDHAAGDISDTDLVVNLDQFNPKAVADHAAAFPDDYSPEGLALIKQHYGDFEAAPITPQENPGSVTDPALLRNPGKMKDALDEYRHADLDARLDPIRHNELPMSDDVVEVLTTREGQNAIDGAISIEKDPTLRKQLEDLKGVVKQLADIPHNINPTARTQIVKQLMAHAPFNVNAAEKISRSLFERAKTAGMPSGVLNDFGRTIRNAAKQDSDFAAAMDAASAQHKAREAVETGEKFIDQNVPADEFVPEAAGLSNERTAKIQLPESEQASKAAYSQQEIDNALNDWQASGAGRITHAIENGGGLTARDAKTLAVITRLVNSGKITDQKLYRGLANHQDPHYIGNDALLQRLADVLNKGNKAPKSHTTSEHIAKEFAGGPNTGTIYDVRYSGRGLDMHGLPGEGGTDRGFREHEVILPPGKFVQDSGQPVSIDDLKRGRVNAGDTPRISGRYVADPLLPESAPAPSNRDLARVGAAGAVRNQAGKGPSEAQNIAKQFYDSPEQMRKTEALIGGAKGGELADRMRGEVEKVYHATRQATKEAPAQEAGSRAVEGFANAMYHPTSPVPWTREVARFLHRIGMTEHDAKWMVSNAIDETQAPKMIELLKKHGMSADRAAVYATTMRDGLVKYVTQQEGPSR